MNFWYIKCQKMGNNMCRNKCNMKNVCKGTEINQNKVKVTISQFICSRTSRNVETPTMISIFTVSGCDQ